MTDRHLQQDFQDKIFNIDGIERECYYCTLEGTGAWFWLRPNSTDKYKNINFVVYSASKIEELHRDVTQGREIYSSTYGYLSQN